MRLITKTILELQLFIIIIIINDGVLSLTDSHTNHKKAHHGGIMSRRECARQTKKTITSIKTITINEDNYIDFLQAPLYFVDILAYCNLLFTTLFTIECCLKVFALGPKVSIIQPSVKYPKPGKQVSCLKQTCLSRTTSKTPGTLLTLSPWSGASSMWRNFSRLVFSNCSGRPGWSSCSGKILWYFLTFFNARNWGLLFFHTGGV